MRRISIPVALLASLALANFASGDGPQQFSGSTCGDNYCDPCDPCSDGGWHRHHHHGGWWNAQNQNAGFNCGCNGSYKFPVPPLYTYHWPGMYQAVLMTDYHSPWRFPPLKPYLDEVPPEVVGTASLRRVQPVAAVAGSTPTRSSQPASFSERLEQSLR